MHELGVAQSIIQSARDEATVRGLTEIAEIGVRVGALSGVLPDALRFCFDLVAREQGFESLRLVIEEIPVTGFCRTCDAAFEVQELLFRCPSCQAADIELTDGMDLRIAWLETAEAEPSVTVHS